MLALYVNKRNQILCKDRGDVFAMRIFLFIRPEDVVRGLGYLISNADGYGR